MPIRRACLALLAAVLVAAPAAFAAAPGQWTRIGDSNLANIDEAALARTPDGVLHVVWTIPASNNDSLVHATIAPNGNVSAPNVIQSGWAAISNTPALVAGPDGLRTFFGGIRTTNPDEPNQNENTATSDAGGSAWNLTIGSVVKSDSAYASDAGAALLGDNTPLLAWGGTGSGVFVHRGLDPATQNFEVQSQLGGCCGYSPNVAVDTKSGAPFVVWISNATGKSGVFAQSLDAATGTPAGAPAQMPGSTTLFNGTQQTSQQLQRAPVAARAGGGVYVAYPGGYPVTKQVRLWRIADSKSAVLATSSHDHVASIAADPDGRLWVLWIERDSTPQIFARRSNKSATKFGSAVKVSAPKGQQSGFHIGGSAQSGALDVVVLFGDSSGKQAQWTTRLLPGLAIAASPAKINGGKSTAVKFTVTDPDAVKGATVSAGGKSATTDASGHATIKLGPTKAHTLTASANKPGYDGGTVKVKVN